MCRFREKKILLEREREREKEPNLAKPSLT